MSYIWIGISILILIIIGVIIAIIVLNRGNTIDIVNSLPNYKIFYPKGNSFLQLRNNNFLGVRDYPVSDPFWIPFVVSDNSDSLTTWVFDNKNISSSFTPLPANTKYVKMVNVVYNETGIGYQPQSPTGPPNPPLPSRIGYLRNFGTYNNGPGEAYIPDAAVQNAYVFRYLSLDNNTFQLRSTDGTRAVYVDENNVFVRSVRAEQEAATFQLVLL